MAFGFGLISAQRGADDPRSWEDVYREGIDLAVALEALGFDSVWTTEHHFVDDGYMPSLLVTSAAIAAVTTTIDIGTGVLLAPLHRPIRLAEDAATVQVISNGRLILGLGLGWSATEYAALGVPMSQRGAAMTEMLQLLPLAWKGDPFRWEGDVYSIPELAVRPSPATPIPVIVGGGVDAAVRRAARYADGFFSNASPKRFVEQVNVATEEMDKIGRDPATFRWIYYSVMYPGPVDEIIESVWHQRWKYSDMEDSAIRTGAIARAPAPTDEQRAKLTRQVLGGTGDEIVAALNEIGSAVGVPVEWMARSDFSDISYERQLDIASKLATDVIPHAPTA